MHFPLRWRILILTVLTPVLLTAAALWRVNRSLTDQVRIGVHDNLERASLVFDKVFGARASRLSLAAQVIVKDPRFSSILSIGGTSEDLHYRTTVQRVARAFNDVADADLFEVLDGRGRLLASVGQSATTPAARAAFLKQTQQLRQTGGILVDGNHQFQVTVVPISSEGRVQGTLLLGASMAEPLARELHTLTHSEVTFVSNGAITASSFEANDERSAVIDALAHRPGLRATAPTAGATAGGRTATAEADRVVELRAGSRTYLTLAREIPQSGAQRGQLYVLQRSLDDDTAFLRDAQAGLLRLGALAAVAALLAGILISERITRPVKRLVRGAEEMERGNYEYPLGKAGRDEIGYLTKRFEDMRQHERAYVLSLRDAARVRSEFIALASHELRTPISVIKGYHELFTGGGLGTMTAGQQKALEAIARSVSDLERLAENATRMTQLEDGRPTLNLAPHDLAAILERAASTAVGEARGRNVEVTLDVDAQLGLVPVDGARLTQVVANLVRNGIQFTPDGGHVSVVARRTSGEMVIDVTDDGIGISAERQASLFERPFMVRGSNHHHSSGTLEFNSGGLGLGLTIARGLVEAHGGTLDVRSAPGEGSTFTIRLPIEGQELRAAA